MSELPRLLFCCFDVVPGPHATSRRLTEYLRGLGARYQVVVLTVKTPDHSHIERYQGARLLRVPVGSGDLRSRMEAFERAVRRQLESEEYAVVHFFDPVSGYPLAERRGDFGYKLVYDACRFPSTDLPSLSPAEGGNKRLLARSRRQELFCLMNADAVIVGAEATRTHCISLGVPAERISVVRAPVDLGPYAPEVLGTPDGEPMRLIHLGDHGLHLGLSLVLDALTRTQTPVKLALVGPSSSELTPALRDRVAELHLESRVEFQEPVTHDDVHKVLAASDVGLVSLADEPRNRTATGLARVSEYLASARPLIAADLPLTRELCPAPATRFYTAGDAASLAATIDALAADRTLRKTMGSAARAMVASVDARLICERVQQLYQRIAPAAVPPADAHVDVGHADATQLGGRPPDENDETQAQLRVPPGLGTSKVKTDPAVAQHTPEADTGTDQAAVRERPPVMGRLLRDTPENPQPELTDPAGVRASQAMPVMGTPLPAEEAPALGDADAPQTKQELRRTNTSEVALGDVASKQVPTDPQAAPPAELAETPAPPAAAEEKPAVVFSADDEPLDFSNLLKPTAAPAKPAKLPPPPPPVPIVVPTSFSLANKSSPSGVRAGPPVLPPVAAPPVVPVPAGPPVLAPALKPAANSSAVAAAVVTVPTPVASSTSGIRALPPPLPSSTSGVRGPPPLPPSSTSGVRAPPPSAAAIPPPAPSLPPLVRLVPNPNGTGAPVLAREAEPVEVREDEVELVNDESFMSIHDGDDDDETEAKEIDARDLDALETTAAPPPSRLDPWFAQLVHGYCPPEAQLFTRHVPPTTMPGRDT